jgi:calreticulin
MVLAAGFLFQTVNNGTIFDNILITDDLAYAQSFGASTWGKIKDGEKGAKEAWEKGEEEEEEEERTTDEPDDKAEGEALEEEEEKKDEL